MDEPSCSACGPKYVRITKFTRGRVDRIPFPTHQGTIYKARTTNPVAEFYCRKCGRSNGHSVREDWEPAPEIQTDEEILNELGAVWLTARQRKVRQPGGGIVIEYH